MDELFCIDQQSLFNYMNKIKSFRELKPIFPYMNHILFESDGEKVICKVADIENSAIIPLKGIKKINKPFKLCVENTFSLALSPRESDIWFNTWEEQCIMHAPNGKVIVPTLNPEYFPTIQPEDKHLFTIKEGILFDIVHNLSRFTHPESTFSNNSLHFVYQDETLRVGATDGKVSCATALHIPCPENLNFMISNKSATMLTDMLNKYSDESCNITQNHNDITFKTVSGTFSCRQMVYDNMYLANDYYRLSMPIISKEADIIKIEDKSLLIEQLQKTMIYTNRLNKMMQIHLERNLLTMESEDQLIGRKSIQKINVLFKHEGNATTIFINALYFMKVIRSIQDDSFEIRIPMNDGPGINHVSEPLSIEHDNFIYLIAPFTK
jgi:DNA polymerase III sliding clamp (beta) subunit (PCNA family)